MFRSVLDKYVLKNISYYHYHHNQCFLKFCKILLHSLGTHSEVKSNLELIFRAIFISYTLFCPQSQISLLNLQGTCNFSSPPCLYCRLWNTNNRVLAMNPFWRHVTRAPGHALSALHFPFLVVASIPLPFLRIHQSKKTLKLLFLKYSHNITLRRGIYWLKFRTETLQQTYWLRPQRAQTKKIHVFSTYSWGDWNAGSLSPNFG